MEPFDDLTPIPVLLVISALLMAGNPLEASVEESEPKLLPLRERAERVDTWLERRLETVVPEILREAGVDTWILLAREYAEDPVVETMLPAKWMSARRRTLLVFHDPTPEGHDGEPLAVERLAVSRYDVGTFVSAWNKEEQPDQWARLRELLEERSPRRIALNVSPTFALADGLTSSQHDELRRALGPELASRIVLDHQLPIRWLETRTPEEMELYPGICAIAHGILAEALSDRVIAPGETTTEDVAWWMRERLGELRLGTWFHPSVSVQRGDEEHSGSFATMPAPDVIRRGDLVHIDFGITYLGLNTDMQQHAYVLLEGEDEAPEGLRAGLAAANRVQDILMEEFRAGRSGNAILAAALERSAEEGIAATIYTHPLGFHGHGAGPTIGLWDQQGGVPGRGDYPLHARTAHSIELNAAVPVPEWGGQTVRIMLEEDAFFDGEACRFMDGRQTAFHLIR